MRIFLLTLLILLAQSFSQPLNIATWNIRYASSKDSAAGDAWSKRIPHIAQMIRFYDFTLVGVQEPYPSQTQQLLDSLPGYDVVLTSEKECHPIFYKKELLQVLDRGQFYYEPHGNPDVRGWDAKHIRYCSWVKFKEGLKEFYVFNVHWDNQGNTSRRESALMTLQKIQEIAEGKPVFVMGDFNATLERSPCKILMESGLLASAAMTAEVKYAPNGSFNFFKVGVHSEIQLDHIWASPTVKVFRYGVLNDTYYDGEVWRYPSDHLPTMVQVVLPEL